MLGITFSKIGLCNGLKSTTINQQPEKYNTLHEKAENCHLLHLLHLYSLVIVALGLLLHLSSQKSRSYCSQTKDLLLHRLKGQIGLPRVCFVLLQV